MTISKKSFEARLIKNLKELEPIVRNGTKKTTSTPTTSSDGTVSVQVTEVRGDLYMDGQLAKSIGLAMTDALDQNAFIYINKTVVVKLNELIAQYNQMRLDLIAALIPTTAMPVKTLPES